MKYSLPWAVCVILTVWGIGTRSSSATKPTAADSPPYVHTVVFYLKADAPRGEAERIIADAHGLLAKIPSVKGLWIGRPADKATPKLAVTDYHVAWTLLFDDFAGLQEYLEHKLHLEFRDRHARHAERVLVYDFINQKR